MGIENDWQGNKYDSRSPAYDHRWEYAHEQQMQDSVVDLRSGYALGKNYEELAEALNEALDDKKFVQWLLIEVLKDQVPSFVKAVADKLVKITYDDISARRG